MTFWEQTLASWCVWGGVGRDEIGGIFEEANGKGIHRNFEWSVVEEENLNVRAFRNLLLRGNSAQKFVM
jgi:hypothetical protein